MIKYTYDAWGNYAAETLDYYNEKGFINADDVSYIEPETIGGLNLYSYCGNNPVMAIDPNGTAWWHWALGVLAVAALVVATILSAGGAAAGIAAIYAAALGTVTGGTTALTTILAFAAVGSGITLAASAIVAGIGSIESWASGGSFMDGVDSFMDYGESAMWSTLGAGILSGFGGYITYKERIGTPNQAGFMTNSQRNIQRRGIWKEKGNENGLASPGMQINHLYGTFGNNRNYYIIQSAKDHRAFHKLYGYKTFGGHFQRENPAYHNWWIVIKNMLGI